MKHIALIALFAFTAAPAFAQQVNPWAPPKTDSGKLYREPVKPIPAPELCPAPPGQETREAHYERIEACLKRIEEMSRQQRPQPYRPEKDGGRLYPSDSRQL